VIAAIVPDFAFADLHSPRGFCARSPKCRKPRETPPSRVEPTTCGWRMTVLFVSMPFIMIEDGLLQLNPVSQGKLETAR
jgi:hypothetical protein